MTHCNNRTEENQQCQIVPTTVQQHFQTTQSSTWIQNQPAFIPSSQAPTSQQAMLQFTQFNIQQTQVQVQVTSQVETYPIISTHRQNQSANDATNEQLPPHLSAPPRPLPMHIQFPMPDLPPVPRAAAAPPPQRQRSIPLHPTGQNWNPAIDKGKEVITHVPPPTVAPPQNPSYGYKSATAHGSGHEPHSFSSAAPSL
jgi:hypothetical protein